MIRIENLNNLDRWRPWRAADMESLMYPHIIVSRFFGLFPYKRDSESYVFSKLRFACSTIIVLAYLSAIAYVMYDVHSAVSYLARSWYESWGIHVFLYLLCDGVLILTTYAFTYNRLIVLQKLSKLSSILSRQDFDDMAKFIHTKDIVVVLYHCFKLLFFIVNSDVQSLRHFIMTYVSCAAIQGEMFYTNCVYILGGCCKKNSEILRHLNHRSELSRTFQLLLHEQDASMLMRLKRCEKLHEEISDVVELLNRLYCGPLTVITIFTFYMITFNLYFFIQWCESVVEMDSKLIVYNQMILTYVVYELMKFPTIIWACETTTNRANQIATTIEKVHADCIDTTVRHELKCFALQVAHRDIKFSAITFNMNAKLLSQLLGQIIIYVLILFQFMFGKNCDNKQSS